jgi:2,4-dienoyl-CoA reductase-like NADH-dependent reductase (Old Yellow Enzyme family)
MSLYEPFPLRCGHILRNRIALAPLTNKQSHADGLLGDDELEFLARRADGGFGLISTCAAYVSLDGKAWDGELGVDRDACVPGLTRLAARLHESGASAIVQLFHGGARADAALTGEAVWSASAFAQGVPDGHAPPRAATDADIERAIDAFAAAAFRAKQAGFDGVELHGAHGYLLSQFLSRTMNLRNDAWGSDIVGRARLIREVTRRVRAACGPQFCVGVRLSLEDFGQAHGLDLDESLQVARWLVEDGADFIHASLWDVSRMSAKRPDQHPLTLLREVLPRDVAIFTAGKIWTRTDAENALAHGADVVALGRSAILNPDWPRMIADGIEPVRPPMTRAELGARAVSPTFQEYLTRWKNFVAG